MCTNKAAGSIMTDVAGCELSVFFSGNIQDLTPHAEGVIRRSYSESNSN